MIDKNTPLLRLKKILKEKGIKSVDFAKQIGVTENTVSNINNGKTLPKIQLLVKIANVLNVDIRDLFNPTKNVTTKDLINKGKNIFNQLEQKI